MDIRFGIDEVRIPGKEGELYIHQLAEKGFMFTCEGVRFSMFDVAHLSGLTTQRIKGAIEGATALRGLNSKTFDSHAKVAEHVRYLYDQTAQDVKRLLANRKVRG